METKLADGALLEELGQRKELMLVWPGRITLSLTSVDQDWWKLGRGSIRSISAERRFRRTTKENPKSGE